jgi:hypothetical protein
VLPLQQLNDARRVAVVPKARPHVTMQLA